MWGNLSNLEHDKYGFKAILQVIIGFLIFAITQIAASIVVDSFYLITRLEWDTIFVLSRTFFEICFFYLALHFYIYKVLKLNLSYFRMGKPSFSIAWVLIAFLLPLTVILYYFLFTDGTISYGNADSILLNIAFALKLGFSAGIVEELLFRGFIMRIIENRWNIKVAILIPSILFTAFHLMKGMGSMDIWLLFIAGVTVSIMFSIVTYHSGNIYNAAFIHIIWNTLIIGLFRISSENDFRSLINYVIENDSILITGGKFGVEAAIPSIIGYLIVIIISFIIKNNYKKESILDSNYLHRWG